MPVKYSIVACPGLNGSRGELGRALSARHHVEDVAPERIRERLADAPPDVLLVDLASEGARAAGDEAARRMPGVAVVALAPEPASEEFIELFRAGFSGYVPADAAPARLLLAIERGLAARELRALSTRLTGRREGAVGFSRLVGESRGIVTVREQVRSVATTNLTVLVTGETGTGKEVVSSLVHELGPRSAEPLVAVHCGGLSPTLVDSELFGHVRGAFTGAESDSPGAFVSAGAGTLFLDEVGTMPASAQVRLLRALQTGCVIPVGGAREVEAPARVVAATNEDLGALVAAGRFRADLFYRLDVVRIDLPPLRERLEDLPLIASHVLHRIARRDGGPTRVVSGGALRRLLAHDWPGNVRELENVLRRATIAAGARLEIAEDDVTIESSPARPIAAAWRRRLPAAGLDIAHVLAEVETSLIDQALDRCGGNAAAAAKLLRVPASTLRRWTGRRSDH